MRKMMFLLNENSQSLGIVYKIGDGVLGGVY